MRDSVGKSPHAHVNGPAFSACAQAGIANAEYALGHAGRNQKADYLFEKGDREHEIHKMVSEWNESESVYKDLRFVSFGPKSTTLLQPADLIAGVIQRCLIALKLLVKCAEAGNLSRNMLHHIC